MSRLSLTYICKDSKITLQFFHASLISSLGWKECIVMNIPQFRNANKAMVNILQSVRYVTGTTEYHWISQYSQYEDWILFLKVSPCPILHSNTMHRQRPYSLETLSISLETIASETGSPTVIPAVIPIPYPAILLRSSDMDGAYCSSLLRCRLSNAVSWNKI